MTLEEWFNKYFAPEYLNVQQPEVFRAQAKEELQQLLGLTSATPAEE